VVDVDFGGSQVITVIDQFVNAESTLVDGRLESTALRLDTSFEGPIAGTLNGESVAGNLGAIIINKSDFVDTAVAGGMDMLSSNGHRYFGVFTAD
jgi:hypothetical protein